MNFFDTHSHLNFKAFDKDRDKVIARSLKEGVFMINVGSDYQNSKLAVEIAEKYQQGVWAAVALHPIHTGGKSKVKNQKSKAQVENQKLGEENSVEVFNYDKFKKLAQSDKVVAIGETGLDAMYPNENQEQVFLEHLRLAEELDLPVILHCRKAHQEMINIIKSKYQNPNVKSNSKSKCQKGVMRGVVHCFTGRWSEAKQYLGMGLYLGFNGIIFKYNVEETIKKAPLDRILIETDCPYLVPPMAGAERNEPIFVKYVAQKIAEIRNEPLEEIAEITTQNAKKLFRLPLIKDEVFGLIMEQTESEEDLTISKAKKLLRSKTV